MKIYKWILVLVCYVNSVLPGQAQNESISAADSTKVKNQLLAYPLAFYLPETRWGFGGAGFYNFRFKNEPTSSFPSQLQFAATVTLNKQILLLLPFELYRKNNLYKLKGEISYFRYQFNYYGIGMASLFSDREPFKVNLPRLKFDFLRRFSKTFLGLRMAYDDFAIKEIVAGGVLKSDAPIGVDGGKMIGLGFLLQNDHRDFLFNSTKGHYVEVEYFNSTKGFGSDFNYQRLLLNAVKYLSILEDHTLVFNLNTVSIFGNAPFFDLAFFGSPKIMRGYQDRRFLDKNMVVAQSEYRFPIYKRFGGVSFISVGSVAPKYADLFDSNYRLAFGAGLRFTLNKSDRVRMRLDYGLTPKEGGAFYLTVNEAF